MLSASAASRRRTHGAHRIWIYYTKDRQDICAALPLRLRKGPRPAGPLMEEAPMNSSLSAIPRRDLLALGALGLAAGVPGLARAAAPAGQLIWGVHVSLAP